MNKATLAETSHFMRLPREIRDMIYVHALVTDYVLCFGGYNVHVPGNLVLLAIMARLSLSISLLSVCKTINAEATLIFYGKNTFALPGNDLSELSPFTSRATLIRRLVVNLPSAGFHTSWKCGSPWKIQPLLEFWRVMLRNLTLFTNLDVVEVNVSELCDAAFNIKYVEGYKESVHGERPRKGKPTSLKYIAGQILSDLSAALAPSSGRRKPSERLKLLVTGAFEWQVKAIRERWEELGAESKL